MIQKLLGRQNAWCSYMGSSAAGVLRFPRFNGFDERMVTTTAKENFGTRIPCC